MPPRSRSATATKARKGRRRATLSLLKDAATEGPIHSSLDKSASKRGRSRRMRRVRSWVAMTDAGAGEVRGEQRRVGQRPCVGRFARVRYHDVRPLYASGV